MPAALPTAITSTDAPAAIGPYSQAVRTGDQLWVSGQLGLSPTSMELVSEDVAAQAEQAMRNLDAICRAAGTSLAKALRCTIYLTDMAQFAAVNEVYAQFFDQPYPARACVQVSALPKGGVVEVDAVVAL